MKQEYLRIVCVLLGRGYSDFTQIDLFLIFVGSHEVLKNLISGSLYCTVLVLFCTPPPIFLNCASENFWLRATRQICTTVLLLRLVENE